MIDINEKIAKLPLDKHPHGLYDPIAYAMASGGKRIRPMLTLMVGEMYDGKESTLVPAALALEMFHNFTLLHDDLMDKAPTRRGRATVWTKWSPNTAILSGDQMLIEAYKLMAQVPSNKLPEAIRLFSKMATEICEGQQMDMDFEHRKEVSVPEYMEMIRLKTSVLLGTALQLGALLSNANSEEQGLLYAIGVNMGLAFQIQDDMLDVWGNPETFGKRIGGDIVDNKKTLALILALREASESQYAELQSWLGRNDDEEQKIAAVRAIYDQIGVKARLEETILEYTQLALRDLDCLDVDKERKEPLRAIINQLQTRKY